MNSPSFKTIRFSLLLPFLILFKKKQNSNGKFCLSEYIVGVLYSVFHLIPFLFIRIVSLEFSVFTLSWVSLYYNLFICILVWLPFRIYFVDTNCRDGYQQSVHDKRTFENEKKTKKREKAQNKYRFVFFGTKAFVAVI